MKKHKSIKLTDDLILKIQAMAKDQSRSFNNMVEVCINGYINSQQAVKSV